MTHMLPLIVTSQPTCFCYLGQSRQSSRSAECTPQQSASHQQGDLNSEGPSYPKAGLVREECGIPANRRETWGRTNKAARNYWDGGSTMLNEVGYIAFPNHCACPDSLHTNIHVHI